MKSYNVEQRLRIITPPVLLYYQNVPDSVLELAL